MLRILFTNVDGLVENGKTLESKDRVSESKPDITDIVKSKQQGCQITFGFPRGKYSNKQREERFHSPAPTGESNHRIRRDNGKQ